MYPPCCLPALNYGGSNEDNGNLCLKVPGRHCHTQYPQPCSRPPPTHASPGDSWPLPGLSGSVSCGVTAPFSWVLLHKVLFVPSKRLFPQSCVSSGSCMVGLMETSSKRAMPYPGLLHPVPLPLRQATADPYRHRRHSNTVLFPSPEACSLSVFMNKKRTLEL